MVTCNTVSVNNGKKLSKVIFPNGEIQLIPGYERADLTNDRIVEYIIVKSPTSILKKYQLKYGYTPNEYESDDIGHIVPADSSRSDLRFTVYSITTLDCNIVEIGKPYKFSYF